MDSSEQLDLKKYWQMLYVKRYVFIGVSLLCFSIILWGSFFMQEVYEAKSTVFIERNVINSLVKNIAITPSLEEKLNVMVYSMKSRNLLLKVIKELDIYHDPDNPLELERLVQKFQEKTDIKLISKRGGRTDLFTVTYRSKNPEMAKNYVNVLVNHYIEDNLLSKRDESYEANRFLTEQMEFFREKLDKAEEKIAAFRREKGLYIGMDERQVVREIEEAQLAMEELDIKDFELSAKMQSLEKQVKGEDQYTVAIRGKLSKDSLESRIMTLEAKLNDLLIRYTKDYPEVIRVMAEIEILKDQKSSTDNMGQGDQDFNTEMSTLNPLHQQLKTEISVTSRELAALNARKKHLRSNIEKKKAYLRDIPEEKRKLSDLERERGTYKKIDEELVFKIGQTEVAKHMQVQDKTETFRLVDPAILPTEPVSPNRVLIIIAGFLVGIAAGFGVVFLLDTLDTSIKDVKELKTAISYPVLAVIPSIISEAAVARTKRIDRLVYTASILYLSVAAVVFIRELLMKYL